MRTRSSSHLIVESSTTLKRRNRRHSKQRVEPFSLQETPVDTMADQRTMAKLLQEPTEGYRDAIITPAILAENSKQFFGFEKEDPHAHIRYFNKITSTLKKRLVRPWDRFKDLLVLPIHGFTELHQLDTFYNGLNPSDQDSLNSAAGGNLLERSAQDVLKIIENKSKVRNSRNKPIVSQVKASNVDSSEIASAVASAVTSAMTAMFKQHQVTPAPASVKAVEESCVTCGGAHSYRQCPAIDGNTFSGYQDNIQGYVSAAAMNYNQGNTSYRPQSVANQFRPPGFAQPNVQNQGFNQNRGNNFNQELHFELSFADALLHMLKFDSMFKSLLNKKKKLFNLAKTPVNENCSAVILKKLPEKLGDPDKFLIPCDFPKIVECLALADLGASINLMPLSIWKKLLLPELTSTRMILELADRSTTIRRPFLRTARALIDVYGEELTLRVDDEAITFKVGETSRYSYNDAESVNRIDVIDVSCKEYAQEVFGFLDSSTSGNPTPSLDPILSTSFPSLTPF
ncbi:reverse transcriptase domain-containing protein, partial [Tanacetum coccineum]